MTVIINCASLSFGDGLPLLVFDGPASWLERFAGNTDACLTQQEVRANINGW